MESSKLRVIQGGPPPREGVWQVVGEGMIMSMIGFAQLFQPKGISISQLQKVLDRVREGRPRVDYYALRESLLYLENDGRVRSEKVMVRGQGTWLHWRLTDWEEWWRLQSRML